MLDRAVYVRLRVAGTLEARPQGLQGPLRKCPIITFSVAGIWVSTSPQDPLPRRWSNT